MNPLLQIIEEQKKEFKNRFGLGLYTRYCTQTTDDKLVYVEMSDTVREYSTSSLKAILQAQVEMLEKDIEEANVCDEDGTPAESHGYEIALQRQINLLQDTINSVK